MKMKIKKLTKTARLPKYAREGDAGADLVADEHVTIFYRERALVSTGIAIEIPDGFVGLIHPRSGLAYKNGITVLNAPGTIDAGFRGEMKVNLINLNDSAIPFEIWPGDRIAQLVIQKVENVTFEQVDSLLDSDRGEQGHGSTGI